MMTIIRGGYAMNLIEEGTERLRQKMTEEWKSRPHKHHSIPIYVWTLQKTAQIHTLRKQADELRKGAKRLHDGLNRDFAIAIYRCATALEQTACDITKQIETAERKHEQRARRRKNDEATND